MLIITTWLWGSKYDIEDVRKLRAGVLRNLREPHVFVLITDRTVTLPGIRVVPIHQDDLHMLNVPGTFCRLRLFDPDFQERWLWNGASANDTDRLVNIDLDTVLTGELDGLDPLFPNDVPFRILQGANAVNPCPYVTAMFQIRRGAHPEIWRDFIFPPGGKPPPMPFFEFPDDQGWLAHRLPGAAMWRAGFRGVYVFQKPGWPPGFNLPRDARFVTFIGWRKPGSFDYLPWVRQYWRE